MVNLFAMERKRVIALIVIGVIVAVLPILIVMLQRQQELRQRASELGHLMYTNPETQTVSAGQQFPVEIKVNGQNGTDVYNVGGADVTISFDKNVLEVKNIQGSSTFSDGLLIPRTQDLQNALATANTTGLLRFSTVNSSSNVITGTNILLATLTFEAKTTGTSEVGYQQVDIRGILNGQVARMSYGTNQPATFTINPANGSPSPSPTDATTTPAATVTLAPTSTPIPGTVISFRVTLPGIGTRSNPSPRRTQRNNVKLELYNASEVKTAEGEGQIVYDRDSGTFRGLIGVGTITPGDYTVKLLVPGYRWQKLGGFVPVTAPTGTYTLAQVTTLHAGDLSGDSDLSIEDFHILTRNCFGEKADLPSCANKNAADLNDDEKVDLVDLNIFIRSFLVLEGD